MLSSLVTNSNYLIDLNSGANTLSITGAVAITGNLSVTGNSTFSGNILGNKIQNGTSNVNIATANGNITITADTGNTWTFDTGGNLTFPTGMIIDDEDANTRIYQSSGALKMTAANVASLRLGWSEFIAANAGGYVAQVIMNGTSAGQPQNVVVRTGNSSSTTYQWYFDAGGNLSAPGNISAVGNITGGNISTGGKILGNYIFAQSGATSAYATKRVLQYVEGTGVVTYSNYIDASSIYITGYAIEIHVSPSALDDSGNGTIGTPVKTIARAQVLAAEAFETSAAGQRKTIVLHPGDYVENVTISTQFTVLTTHELVGKNTTLSGTLTITKGCTIDGLKMTNLVISADNTTGSVDIIGCTVTTAVTKTSSAYTVFRGCDISSASLSITGTGSTVLVGGNYFTLAVNNAAAGVLAKSVVSMGPVTLTAGTLQLADTLIYAAANTGNAITQSVGSVITVNNCQTLIPDLTNVARNSFGGFYSILNAVYDKANSTFAGTSLNSILYSQYINADRLTIGQLISATGNITGGNISTGGAVKTGSFVTGNIPVATGVGAGARAFVTDADSITFGNLYVGGAANAMPVWSNGTSWYVG